MDETITTEEISLTQDSLLECLAYFCQLENRAFSPFTATAGLPLINGQLTPALFVNAAKRFGFMARIVKRDIHKIPQLLMPVLLILKNNRACILTQVAQEKVTFFQTEEHQLVERSCEEIKEEYSGYCIYIKSVYQFDQRAAGSEPAYAANLFWEILFKYKKTYIQVILSTVLINLFALAMPLVTMNIYDRVVPNNSIETLWVLASGIFLVFIFDTTLRILRHYLVDYTGKKTDTIFSGYLFQKIIGVQIGRKTLSSGALLDLFNQFEVLREFFTSITLTAFIDLPFTLIFVVTMAIIGGTLAVIPLVAAPLIILIALIAEKKMNTSIQKMLTANIQKQALLVEAIENLETIKGFGYEGTLQRRFEQCLGVALDGGLESRHYSAYATNFTYLIQQMANIIILVAGVYLIAAGKLTMGGLIACVILGGRAIAPLSVIANVLTRFHQSRLALKNLNAIILLPPERNEDQQYLACSEIKGDIHFDKVTFTYPNQKQPALNQMNFQIKAGEKVGIVGRIGAGKSSIYKLCLGYYYAEKGVISLDGIDITQIDPSVLRKHIGYLAERSQLFYGTLRDNLLLGKPTANMDEIRRAVDIAGISQFIDQHPMGYDMMIGERGEGLSNGQRRAICLARVLLRNPSVLLLDEPTSIMDNNTEHQIVEKLRDYSKNITLLIITHRLPVLNLVDRILVIDSGKIILDGPKDQVIETLTKGKQSNAEESQ